MKTFLCLTLLFLVQGAVSAETIVGVRASEEPKLDGTLNDPRWETAAIVSDFRQREPFEGMSPTENTIVKILYDRRFLYFGIQCSDANPNNIVATELRRDGDYKVDDHFTILISPNNDRRNGYTFTINPLGTQFDSLIADEGVVNDPNWDGVWTSFALVGEKGWTATLAIPFSTLNFKTSDDVSLGINFRRFIRRKNEEDLWQAYLRTYGIERISEGGELTGLVDIGSGRLLIMKPYALGGIKSADPFGKDALNTGGLDVKYGVRSDMVLNFTTNTDFAEADVDAVRFNLTPFKIFIPEKRQFFLENGGIFQFGSAHGTQLFFSRQIGIDPSSGEQVPIDAGAKLTGSLGDYELGILEVKTRDSDLNPWANYIVARGKRRLLSDSYIGAIVMDKENGDPQNQYNRAFGFDGKFRFFKKLDLQGFLAKTSSFRQELNGRDWAGSIEGIYRSNLFSAEFLHSNIQPNFDAEIGFIERTDLVTDYVAAEFTPRPKHGPVRQFYFIGAYQLDQNTEGALQTQQWQATFISSFHNGSMINLDLPESFIQRLTRPFNIFRDVVIPPGVYHFNRWQLNYRSDRSKPFFYDVTERFGDFYNGKLNQLATSANYRPNPRISIGASYDWNRFHFGSEIFHVQVGSIKMSYSLNRFLTTSLLAQVNSVDKNPVSANFRLRYSYRPDSDLYVIYTIGSQFNSLEAGNPILTREQRLTVKLTYSWSR